MKLLDFAFNEFSQHGEDGMIEKILEWLKIKQGLAIEFGAWDGYHFANTARLWTTGWDAILIEGDHVKFSRLEANVDAYKNVKPIEKMVGIEKGTQWHEIDGAKLADIVSIDVDGNDYWIFADSPFGPSLYIVEYNTTIPGWMDIYTPYASDNYFGCSLGALERVAKEKGYEYIGSTRSNGFFLRADLKEKLPPLECDLRDAANKEDLVYLMTSFGGEFKATKVGPYGRGHFYEKEVLVGAPGEH